jgi:hypothetical protein
MRQSSLFFTGSVGVALGVVATMFYLGQPRIVGAASNDRYQDYVIATGAVSINPRIQTDGVWLLDYRAGKLLGSVIDKAQGKIVGFAEVDLAGEFGVEPRQDVHFMMTTGYVTQGQSALYLVETSTGKMGIYTMGPGTNGQNVVIRRHDMTNFRNAPVPAAASSVAPRDVAAGIGGGIPVVAPQSPAVVPGAPIMK